LENRQQPHSKFHSRKLYSENRRRNASWRCRKTLPVNHVSVDYGNYKQLAVVGKEFWGWLCCSPLNDVHVR